MRPENGDDSTRMDPEKVRQSGQSGGINVFGGQAEIKGDAAGRDINKEVVNFTDPEILKHFEALMKAIHAASPEKKEEAVLRATELKEELKKGAKAEDSRVAKLIDGLIALVPSAVSAVVGMFTTPILSGIAGPATKFVLDKIQGK